MSVRSRLLMSALAAATVATPALSQTDPAPALLDFVAPNRLALAAANFAIGGLRTQMEFTYEHISTDILRGTMALSGVRIRPQFEWDVAGQCEVTADRVTLTSDFAEPFDVMSEATLDIIGAEATLACLDRSTQMAVRSMGFSTITLDQARTRLAYVYSTGEIEADTTLSVNGFATLDYSASGTFLPRRDDYGYMGDPAIRLSRAVVTLKDEGGWAAAASMLPAEFQDPEAIRQIGTEGILQALSEGGTRNPTAVERNFVDQLMDQVAAYVAEPGEITIEADLPPGGSVIEPEMLEDPGALISAIALTASAVPSSRSAILGSAELSGLSDPEQLSDDDRLSLAGRLLSGDGVPRAPGLVPDLVAPLIEGGGPQSGPAAAFAAEALSDTDPVTAYGYALVASSAGTGGPVSLYDRLEARMTTGQVMTAQADHLEEIGDTDPLAAIEGDDPRDLRAAVLDYLTGAGAPRSYARAYYYAILAEAAGDFAATPLRQEIVARFSNRGDDVAARWREASAEIEAQAIADWIDADLPARYAR
ncbi:hypothetical protein [Pelagovum pacificum]|uniref:Sel1 repeat family protein n=1 Tax=Pelagovum pacificum TaxID=2588711 RepID=A0A5C5GB02_9RHOB|nr:hypothetical protein [Pelagovum pacificum]QQA41220.1 hypothetical protein I8N54_10285 [Pelagovum pacificum]TNY31972.1 hypothetical protein FHY64_01315 [Pelagovum pacificum]